MPVLLQSGLSTAAKVEALLHLTGYGIQLLMLAASLLYPLLLTAQLPAGWHNLLLAIGIVLGPTVLAPPLMFLTAQHMLRPDKWWRELPGVAALSVLGAGLVLNHTRALLRGLRSRRSVFERTPKLGLTGSRSGSQEQVYRPQGDRLVLAEFLLAAWNLYAAGLAWSIHNPGIFVNALLFAAGLLFVAGSTVWEMRAEWRRNLRWRLRGRPQMPRRTRSVYSISPALSASRSEDLSPGDVV